MRVGSLFSGYGGLDMAVGGDLAWYSEIEPAACKVMEAHYPGVRNLGDITAINWAEVEPVDILTGGYPCQPFSHAGHRKGKNDERHLWPYVRDAIRTIRPRYAILENVSAHLTLGFADVLADLAEIGWSCEWRTVRASDIGAPHRRERLFIVAYSTCGTGREGQGRGVSESERATGLATHSGEFTAHAHGQRSQGHDGGGGEASTRGHGQDQQGAGALIAEIDWGKYAPAIRRWESVLGRNAPDPVVMRNDKRRLNPVFVEWMMGLPDGWVTGHGLSAAQELKMLGNGVVPQQARLALTLMDAA